MGKFPDILKKAEVTPVYEKDDMNGKQNDRRECTLSNLSKVFVKLIYSQINIHMSDKFSKYLRIGPIITDLYKAFDALDHSLLIAKLEEYSFDSLSLEFMKSYLTNKKQRCKVGNCFFIRRTTTLVVPQGYIVESLLLTSL